MLFLVVCNNNNTPTIIPYVQAQQKPFTTVQKFDTSVSYRNNFCDRQRQLWDGNITFPEALRGLNLTVAITNYQTGKEQFLFSLKNGRIPEKEPGFFAVILDEVARRAGFSWRDSFFAYEPRNQTTDGDKSWTDILLWAITVADVSMEKWGQSLDRMAAGASFPVGFFDSSLVLGEIYQPGRTTREVDLWSFLAPFGASLWFTIVATVLFSGMVYWLIEHWNKNADARELDAKPIATIFYAAIVFTGHYELKPQTHPARLLGFSVTFWALIVSATYTANLASFLVTPRVYNYKYSTLEDAFGKDARLCVQGGAILQTIMEEKYPGIQTVGKDSEKDIFAALRLPKSRGGCDAVAHQLNVYELYEHDKDVNYDCAIGSEKRIQEVLPSGMATAIVDSCTSLVSHVLDYHLTSMIDDGFIEQAWRNHLDRHGTVECVRETNHGGGFDEEDTFSLTLVDVGGIFIVHVALSLVAIAIATYQFYVKWRKGLLPASRSLQNVYGITYATKKLSRRRGLLDNNDVSVPQLVTGGSETAGSTTNIHDSSANFTPTAASANTSDPIFRDDDDNGGDADATSKCNSSAIQRSVSFNRLKKGKDTDVDDFDPGRERPI